jgi:hypothetical protein
MLTTLRAVVERVFPDDPDALERLADAWPDDAEDAGTQRAGDKNGRRSA